MQLKLFTPGAPRYIGQISLTDLARLIDLVRTAAESHDGPGLALTAEASEDDRLLDLLVTLKVRAEEHDVDRG